MAAEHFPARNETQNPVGSPKVNWLDSLFVSTDRKGIFERYDRNRTLSADGFESHAGKYVGAEGYTSSL